VINAMAAGAPDDVDTYRRHAGELMRYATALVGPDDAPDVVTDGVLAAFAAPGWSDVVNRRAYLYRAVVNEATTWRSRAERRPVLEARAAGTGVWELPTLRPDVAVAVAALSVRQKAVVVLTYWADLDVATVADRLGISEGAVRSHLARARARLREALDA
jgi:RNA polymerase sigma-70 factor (ECF subfamily)